MAINTSNYKIIFRLDRNLFNLKLNWSIKLYLIRVKLENEFTPSGSPQENMKRDAEVNLLKAPEKKIKKKNKACFQSVTS